MKIRFARSAEADLLAIADWISEDNPRRAASFLRELRDRCFSLSRRPNRFPSVGQIGGRSVRKLSYRGYLALYVVDVDAVEIVRIVHGARDWAAWLDAGS